MTDLARRLVAAPWWEWCEGMRFCGEGTRCGGRILEGGPDFVIAYGEGATRDGGGIYDGPVDGWRGGDVDLTDPATVGPLLGMLGCEYKVISDHRLGCWAVIVYVPATDQVGGWHEHEHNAGTLGEAVALALLEVRGG